MQDRVTVDGVEAPFDAGKLKDMRLVIMLGDIDDDSLAEGEKVAVLARLTRYLFGSERERIMDDVAEANGGTLDNATFWKWLATYLREVGAKN